MKHPCAFLAIASCAALALFSFDRAAAADAKPNIIFILADDLGYGDLGCYGQKEIQTPNIDRLAAEGMKFTHFYSGASVCAPSRCVLMTGKHGGRCRVRGNAPMAQRLKQSLMPEDLTVARMLKQAGYATALVGKWGLGDHDTPGHPLLQGFDFFFGYLDQVDAHVYYPTWLWRNREKVMLPNKVRPIPVGKDGAWGTGGIATKRAAYSPKLMLDEALGFIERSKSQPFFLYFATTIPHANNEAARELGNGAEVPDLGPYKNKPWPEPEKGYAAMISHLDTQVGAILRRLKALGLNNNTLVIFTSDNGPEMKQFAGYDTTFFKSANGYRGFKRDHLDGGIRMPMLARWPGKIKAGGESTHVGYFGDFMATAAELADVKPPTGLDSISLVPTLLGRSAAQKRHECLYWEYHAAGSSQAVLLDGRWKALRNERRDAPLELYDLQTDLAESNNVAAAHPDIVAKAEARLKSARVENDNWPLRSASTSQPPPKPAPVRIILDTDMSGDCDDAGALALLHALADRGEYELLAVVTNRKDKTHASAAAVDAINTYYGRPNIPIGTDKVGPTDLQRTSSFTRALRDEFPHKAEPDGQMPDALDVYRRALAAQPDDSVTICSVGAFSNLAELWRREPALVMTKVHRLVVMGGEFPASKRPETNVRTHREAARFVAAEWPTELVWHGWEVGNVLITGAALKQTPRNNPVRRAYELKPFGKRPAIEGGQPSWDQGAALCAVRGAEPAFWQTVRGGRVVVDEEGVTTWEAGAVSHHSYVKIKAEPAKLAAAIESLMIQSPKHSSHP